MRVIKVLLLSLLTLPALAQYEPKTFEYGPKLGINLSNVNPMDTMTYSQKSKFGLQGGVFTRFNYKRFSLQPEFIYQAKGSNLSKPHSGAQTYRYLSTPVILGYTPIKQVYLEAGYEHSWALNKLKQAPIGSKPWGPGQAQDNSLIFGTRINLLDGFSLFSLNLRYVHGLKNVSTLTKGDLPIEFKNRSFQVSATYTFSEHLAWKKKFGDKKK